MSRRAAAGLVCAGVLAAAMVAGVGYPVAHPPLGAPIASALARGFGLSPQDVPIDSATLGAPAILQVRGLRVGPARAELLEVRFDLMAALSGHARPRRLTATEVSLTQPLPLSAHELAVELTGRQISRAAFSGARIGDLHGAHIDGLAGAITHELVGWRIRAARPGLVLTGRSDRAETRARIELDRLPLASLQPLAQRAGLALARATATGTLELERTSEKPRAHLSLLLAELSVDHRAIAPRAIGPASLTVEGDGALRDGVFTLDALQVALGPIHTTLSGRVDHDGAFSLEAQLDPVGCAELLRALPRDLAPTLDGLVIDGTFSARAVADGARGQWGELQLSIDPKVGCRVVEDPPLADARSLAQGAPLLTHATFADGRARRFPLGPENPAWRSLRSLPDRLLSALVAAEDGHFFRHHGFDAENIRRALIADLGAGRFERGASTISQQVVKNMFLTGDRSLARKLEETVLVWRLEQVATKRRILELYVNLVELGPGIYGVGEASDRYFGKEPDGLSLDEAAQLAALLPAPRRGMDAAWDKRYQLLRARLPSERVTIPPPPGEAAPRPILALPYADGRGAGSLTRR